MQRINDESNMKSYHLKLDPTRLGHKGIAGKRQVRRNIATEGELVRNSGSFDIVRLQFEESLKVK